MEILKQNQTPIGLLSLDARILFDRLLAAAESEVITYVELSALIDKSVQEEGRGFLDTAREKLLRERNFVFATVRGVGVKRLRDGECAEVYPAARDHCGRTIKRAKRKVLAADYEKLTGDERRRRSEYLIDAAIREQFDLPDSRKRIAAAASDSGPAVKGIDVKKMLEAFE